MFRIPHFPSALAIAVGVAACGGESPIEPGPDSGPVTAFIDGEAFVATTVSVTRPSGEIIVDAVAGGRTLRLEFDDLGVRNHVVGIGNPVSAELTIAGEAWVAEEAVGSGTIQVTGSGPGFLQGSFQLTMVGGPNQTSVNVTSGRFTIIGQ